MNNEKKYPVVAIIPSLNPDENLRDTVRKILQKGFSDVILVDDGSKKECQYFFDELSRVKGIHVLHHDINKGKGAALKTAFKYYVETFDLKFYIGGVTADADGQHLANDIKKTAEKLKSKCSEMSTSKILVLGTRDFNDSIVPFKSKWGNKITTTIFWGLYGKKIHDTQTGLRAISNKYIEECILLSGERFEYEMNMLMDAVTSRINIYEESIATVYLNQNRETHFNPIKDSVKIYKLMFLNFIKFSCTGLISMLLDQGIYALLTHFIVWNIATEGVIIFSTIIARICSSLFNFFVNKKIVFKSDIGIAAFIRYYMLCACQMLASAVLVTCFYVITHLDSSFIKIFVDFLLFFVSYQIQRRWVF